MFWMKDRDITFYIYIDILHRLANNRFYHLDASFFMGLSNLVLRRAMWQHTPYVNKHLAPVQDFPKGQVALPPRWQ